MANATTLCRFALIMTLALAPFSNAPAQQTMQLADEGDARDLYAQAETLLAGGHTRNAYELLRAYESEFAGNPYFDYLLGVASLDAGHTSAAILALRRAVDAAPQYSAARMELARALYDAGEYAEARPMFTALLGESPPAAVRDIIDGYVRAIDARPSSPPSNFLPYGELSVGYDTNANGSTDEQQFLGFMLSPENQETDSAYYAAAAGFDWRLPRSTNFGWVIGARAGLRDNNDAPWVDAGVASGLVSMNWRSGAVFGRTGLAAYAATRDGESNESYGGFDFLLGRNISELWDLSVSVRSGGLRYDDSIEVLDVDRTMYSLATSYRFAPRGRLSIEAIGGSDDEQQSGSPYGNSKIGGRMGLIAPLSDSAFLVASIGGITSDYDGLFYGSSREDKQYTSMVQLEFRDAFTNGLTLAPRLRHVNNESDVDLYTYTRTEVGLMIRWAPR